MMDDSLDNDEEEEELVDDEDSVGRRSVTDMDINTVMTNDSEKIDSSLIKKILIEMKSEFTRGVPTDIDGSDDRNRMDSEENVDSAESRQDNSYPSFKVSDIINLKKFGTTQDESDDEKFKDSNDRTDSKCAAESNNKNSSDKNKGDFISDNSKCNLLSSETDTSGDLKSENSLNTSPCRTTPVKQKTGNPSEPVNPGQPSEPKRKRSLRKQNVANTKETEDDNNGPSGLKRSSRRCSKDFNCESVLQNAIARKEKSFNTLSSSEERAISKRGGGHRSPRRGNSNGSLTPTSDFGKSSTSSKSSNNKNSLKSQKNSTVNSEPTDSTETQLKIFSSKSQKNSAASSEPTESTEIQLKILGSKTQKNSTASTEPNESTEIQLKIFSKNTNYDEKLQNTIDQLKSTIEHGDISTTCDKKSKQSLDLPVFDSSFNKTSLSLKIEQELQIESSMSTNVIKEIIPSKIPRTESSSIVVNEKDTVKAKLIKESDEINPISDKIDDSKRHRLFTRNSNRLAVKKKTRYFKGLKYTIKGGHVKSSSRTLSTRMKKFETEKSLTKKALERKQASEEDDKECEITIRKSELVRYDEDEKMDETNSHEVQKTESNISHEVSKCESPEKEDDVAKRMLSIFGVSHAPGVCLPDSNIGNEPAIIDTKENCFDSDKKEDISENIDLKSRLSLAFIENEDDKLSQKVEQPEVCEEDVPLAKDEPDLPLHGTCTSSELPGVFTESFTSESDTKLLCMCNSNDPYYASPSSRTEFYCQAIDSLDGRYIGCCNTVDATAARLVRSSFKLPYSVLCVVHYQRLQRHNSCPGCGAFCTQGVFVQCKSGHHFHKDCQQSVNSYSGSNTAATTKGSEKQQQLTESGVCLHCGCDSFCDVQISLGAHKYPVFLPLQKPPKQVLVTA